MKKYMIPLMPGLLLAIRGATGTNVLTPLIRSNMADNSSISSNNHNTLENEAFKDFGIKKCVKCMALTKLLEIARDRLEKEE